MFKYTEFRDQILNATKIDLELADRCYQNQVTIDGAPIIDKLVDKDSDTVSFEIDVSMFTKELGKLVPFVFGSEKYLDITSITLHSQYLVTSTSKSYPYTDIFRLVTTDFSEGHFFLNFAITDGGIKLLKSALDTHCIDYFDAITYPI